MEYRVKKLWREVMGLTLASFFLITTAVSAQSVDLLWQADTYTPPFYKGKALWSTQSRGTVVAIPQGLGNSANLHYKWTLNGTILGNINGVGKNYVSFTDPVVSGPQEIKLEIIDKVSAKNSSTELLNYEKVLASASLTIRPSAPLLSVYENSPLYGFMFHKAVDSAYTLLNEEVTFMAFPLFFSVASRSNTALNYEWRSNNTSGEKKSSVTYRAPEGVSGTSRVDVSVSNTDKILQSTKKGFLIKFGEQ